MQTHSVYVKKDTLLYDIVGKQKFFVNSFHHQAIKVPGEGILASAAAPDGVIEAVELKNHKFFLLYTPEYHDLVAEQTDAGFQFKFKRIYGAG